MTDLRSLSAGVSAPLTEREISESRRSDVRKDFLLAQGEEFLPLEENVWSVNPCQTGFSVAMCFDGPEYDTYANIQTTGDFVLVSAVLRKTWHGSLYSEVDRLALTCYEHPDLLRVIIAKAVQWGATST